MPPITQEQLDTIVLFLERGVGIRASARVVGVKENDLQNIFDDPTHPTYPIVQAARVRGSLKVAEKALEKDPVRFHISRLPGDLETDTRRIEVVTPETWSPQDLDPKVVAERFALIEAQRNNVPKAPVEPVQYVG